MRMPVVLAGCACFALILALAAAVPIDMRQRGAGLVPSPRPAFTAPPLPAAGPADPRVGRGSRAATPIGRLRVPIAGLAVPSESELLPEAARDYRAGTHEGIDFPADAGTPVLAAGDGIVVRADRGFDDWSDEERATALAEAVTLGRTPQRTLDLIRGRQVWIDHGRGITTRYAHLQSVGPISVGDHVRSGDVVGAVGSSGLPEGGPHLHFEIRIGDSYLGDGLTPAELARALRQTFR